MWNFTWKFLSNAGLRTKGLSFCRWHFQIYSLDVMDEISSKYGLRGLIDDTSTLFQLIAWCRQATSHYLSQCWPRSSTPYGVTRPQWVNYNFKYIMQLHSTFFQTKFQTLELTRSMMPHGVSRPQWVNCVVLYDSFKKYHMHIWLG